MDLSKPVTAAFYSGGENVPSARFRVRQYLDVTPRFGVKIDEFPSRAGKYPPPSLWDRPGWLLSNLVERGAQISNSHNYDAVIFQRELISTLLTFEPLFGKPRLLDVDDAIWQHRRGSFASRLALKCDAVICGNSYLADYFSDYCGRIYTVPTAVDTKRFSPAKQMERSRQIIGWSGSHSNLVELEHIQPALRIVLKRFKSARLRVISNQRPKLEQIPQDRIDYIPWSPDIEVSALQDLRVGLMPLVDSPWTRGKCAFKMLTYMACGLPVVVSPVGMNTDVLAMGDIGFGPRTMDEWVDALTVLLEDEGLSQAMGQNGHSIVEGFFSVEILGAKLAAVINEVV